MTLNDVKNYIRAVDEDDNIVLLCMESAKSYLQDAVDDFDNRYANGTQSWKAKADLAMMQLCGNYYENRGETDNIDIPKTVRLIIYQLQNDTTNSTSNSTTNGGE